MSVERDIFRDFIEHRVDFFAAVSRSVPCVKAVPLFRGFGSSHYVAVLVHLEFGFAVDSTAVCVKRDLRPVSRCGRRNGLFGIVSVQRYVCCHRIRRERYFISVRCLSVPRFEVVALFCRSRSAAYRLALFNLYGCVARKRSAVCIKRHGVLGFLSGFGFIGLTCRKRKAEYERKCRDESQNEFFCLHVFPSIRILNVFCSFLSNYRIYLKL